MNDDQFSKSLGSFMLMRAVADMQKRGRKPTVLNLAESLGVSVASMYRPPFGKSAIRVAIKRMEGSGDSRQAGSIESTTPLPDLEKSVANEGLRIRRKRTSLSTSRAIYFQERRRAQKNCYLVWRLHRDEVSRLATAVLWCFFEVPRHGRPKWAENRKIWRSEKIFTRSEVSIKLGVQAIRGDISDWENVASIRQSLDGKNFEWRVGDDHGKTTTFKGAVKQVENLRVSSPLRTVTFHWPPGVSSRRVSL